MADSHARGFGGELLRRANQRFRVIGEVKQNAGLTELLN
jgi:hypothetical protein